MLSSALRVKKPWWPVISTLGRVSNWASNGSWVGARQRRWFAVCQARLRQLTGWEHDLYQAPRLTSRIGAAGYGSVPCSRYILRVNYSVPMTPSLLILTDFFQAANRALDYATNLAQPLGARLVLLHVRRNSMLDPERLTGGLSNLNNEALNMALSSMTSNLSVPVVAEVGHGRVATAVADAVDRHHPALIVLGRPNTEDTPDELVRTTALDMLRTAPYPMLVVPYNVQTTRPPRRVLLAADGEAFSLGQHAAAAQRLLHALQAEVTVLHVEEYAGPTATTAAALASVAATGLTAGLPEPIRTLSIVAPAPAEAILRAAQPADFDVVVLIARPRSFFGELFHHSVTAQVLLHSAVPVLVLPAME